MTQFVEQAFIAFKGQGKPIKYVRMDGGGENEGIKKLCLKNGATLEKTPPYTPQYNGKIERRFAVLMSCAMTLLWNAKFAKTVKQKFMPEAIETANFLHDMMPTSDNRKSHYERWYGYPSKWTPKHLIEFGRVGHVTITEKKPKKGEEKSEPMIMVGYARDSPVGTYRMWNPKTNRIVNTDSVRWSNFKRWVIDGDLKGIYEEAKKLNKGGLPHLWDEYGLESILAKHSVDIPAPDSQSGGTQGDVSGSGGNTTETEVQDEPTPAVEVAPPVINTPGPTRVSARIAERNATVKARGEAFREKVAALPSEPLTDGTRVVTGDTVVRRIELADGTADVSAEIEGDTTSRSVNFVFNTSLNSDPGEPLTWEESQASSDKEWWSASAIAEFNNFLKRDSWTLKPKAVAKKAGRKLIGTKLVFKKKEEADDKIRYKTRCVSKGYMQIPGVDYTEKFSPVATNQALFLLLALILYYWDAKGWRAKGFDVEAAFLEGNLETPMYLDIPHALVDLGFITEQQYQECCIELGKGMYGNVDAALRFFIRFTQYLTSEKVGLIQSKVDPCVFFKKDTNGDSMLIAVVTVDDCVVGGKPDDIKALMDLVEEEFNITRDEVIKKHLGVDYLWERDGDGNMSVRLTMVKKANDIVAHLEWYLGREIKVYDTPGKPSTILPKNEGEILDLSEFRSLVGKIMFFTSKIGPTLAYAVRDLAAHMSRPGEVHWEAMERCVGYLKGLEVKGVTLYKPEELRHVSACDADFAKCPETRKSVGGEIHTLGGCLQHDSAKGQTTVSLSTCESEYKSGSNCSKEMKFEQMLLEEVDECEYPGVIYEDNEGCIFLVYNKQVSQRTKHIDVAAHFIREFCTPDRNGLTRGIITKIDTSENPADIFTKNTDVKTFQRHAEEIKNGFPLLRQKAFGDNGTVVNIDRKLLGGMSKSANIRAQLAREM